MRAIALFHLLTVLQEETDRNHKMSQQRLLESIERRYGIILNRRTLKSYLNILQEAGYPLNAEKRIRILPDGSEEEMLTDWYLEPQFEISELRLICDLLSAMPAIPEAQRESLLTKIMTLAPPTFRQSQQDSTITYLHSPPAQQLLYSIELLCEAMQKKCMVSFQYGKYTLDQNNQPKLTPRCSEEGRQRRYLISPYEIIVSHGHYYLICCKEPYQVLSNYRIDRIMEIKLEEKLDRLPISETEGSAPHNEHYAEQLYMYQGDAVEVKFLADSDILGDILDWFGNDISIQAGERVNTVIVKVNVNPTAMTHWALQYGKHVTVLSPVSLRDEIAGIAHQIMNRYAT
ncbi:MAG: WYL domain-containing protein [Oscillospiraceae bacterium]|nr:WYL domain-containing protein [Oscillospiraceae bacterium]